METPTPFCAKAQTPSTTREARLLTMPTPLRAIRIPDELWQAFQAQAKEEGRDASTIIREIMRNHLQDTKG